MNFCTEQDSQDTHCCFFIQDTHYQIKNPESSKQARNAVGKQKNLQKYIQSPLKQTRMITKNHRKIKSQDRPKNSLNKLSLRRGNSCRDRSEKNQASLPIDNSKISGALLQVTQTQNFPTYYENSQNNLTYPHKLVSAPSRNQHPIIIQNPRQQLYLSSNVYATHQKKTYTPPVFTINFSHFPIENSPSQHYVASNNNQNYSQCFFNQQGQQINTPLPINRSNLRILNRKNMKKLQHQSHTEKIQKSIFQLQIKNKQPTPVSKSNTLQLQHQTMPKNFLTQLQFIPPHQSTYRPYNEYRGIGFNKNLKTVYSVYSQQNNLRNQVHESAIMIDFFNPPQRKKQQLQANISNRFHDSRFVYQ